MPLINGMKMACEPCIRGHRSTKCTHANERLMVPVRKPGRPLSACPHPLDQPCGCGSVTAAIPRKQTCHCGSDSTTVQYAGPPFVSRAIEQPPTDPPSPNKVTFKVQKPPRPQSSRKQSFDPANFERMNMDSVNIVSFEQRPQVMPGSLTNGYTTAAPTQMSGHPPQYPNIQLQYGQHPMQPFSFPHSLAELGPGHNNPNGFSAPVSPLKGLDMVTENSVVPVPTVKNGGSKEVSNGTSSCCTPQQSPEIAGPVGPTNGGSCCAPKSDHRHTTSNASLSSESQKPIIACSCSSKPRSQTPKREPISNNSAPRDTTPQISHQALPQNGVTFNPMYPQYLPQTTVFAYPPSYGSFQNPLQPYAWRHSVRANPYVPPQMLLGTGSLPFETPLVPETMETLHTCHCGDTCRCIGCAAHPYNDATQNYVRSAWSSMLLEQPGEMYASGGAVAVENGTMSGQPPNEEAIASPTAHTPTSTNSGNGEEQNLSATDFFFVNYPFTSDGCGGDTQSCPCGDDCQCLGCTIHQGPPIPCGGEHDTCPCDDSCECIGCIIHNVGSVV